MSQRYPVNSTKGSYLDGDSYKAFWISWANGDIVVGEGTIVGKNEFLRANIQQDVRFVGVTTGWGAAGHWAFGYGDVSEIECSALDTLKFSTADTATDFVWLDEMELCPVDKKQSFSF